MAQLPQWLESLPFTLIQPAAPQSNVPVLQRHAPPAVQLFPAGQLPQDTGLPHWSVTEPQTRPLHAEEGFEVHPQTLAVPPPPQLCGETQLLGQVPPHPLAPPHLSVQAAVHPQTLAVPPPPQLCGATQLLGQVPPHPSAPPHLPVQLGAHPQTLAVPPPPQVWPVPVQVVEHCTDFPHLSVSVPQWPVHSDESVHPHRLGVPPPPQVWAVPEHVVEHCTVLPQLLVVGPQWPPAQVVAEGSSVQVAQSLRSAVHWLLSQVVFV